MIMLLSIIRVMRETRLWTFIVFILILLGFFYSKGSQTFGNTTTYFQEIPVSKEMGYRKDFSGIVVSSFVFIFGIVVLFNLVSSMFKKGGLLGGLV